MTGRQQRILTVVLAVALIGLVAVSYRHVPDNSFHYDDLENIVNRDALHVSELSLESLADAADGALLKSRVVSNLTFAVDWSRGGGSPKPFLVTNIIIHSVAVLAVFGLLLGILRRWAGAPDAWLRLGAFAGAAVWAVHPIQLQAVTYIVQRMAAMAALFVALSALCYLRARLGPSRTRWVWYALAGLSFALGLFSKENAAITPLLILLLEFGVVRHGQALLRRPADRLWLAIPGAVAMVVLLHWTLGPSFLPDLNGGFDRLPYSMGERLLTQPRVLAFHLGQILWPTPDRFAIVHELPVSTSWLDPWTTVPAILLLAALLSAGVWFLLRPPTRLQGALLLWIPVSLAVESSYLPLRLVFEHRMYLPTVGLAGLFALGFARLSRWERGFVSRCAALGIVPLLLALSWSTAERSKVWRDDLTLWKDVVARYPGSAEGNNNIGWYYWTQGDLVNAIPYYEAAVRNNPNYPESVLNLARSYAGVNRIAEALHMFERARILVPDYPDLYFSLGMTYIQIGDFPKAVAALETAVRLDPGHPQAGMFLRYAYGQMPQVE